MICLKCNERMKEEIEQPSTSSTFINLLKPKVFECKSCGCRIQEEEHY